MTTDAPDLSTAPPRGADGRPTRSTGDPVRVPQDGRLRRHAPLLAAMLGFFVVALDAQIVNVALPDIGRQLGGGLTGLQWVVTSYTLTFSALLLLAGTVSDRIGARRAYAIGMAVFVIASAVCGLAPDLPVLLAARVAQGVGAALITPTSLALIREAYTDARARARAVAYWALGGSVAAAAGPVLGGVLTGIDWRWIFLMNLPVGLVAALVLARVAPSPRRAGSLDGVGQVSAVVALVSLTFAVIEGNDRGYGDPVILAMLVLAAVGTGTFLAAQARGTHPMVPLDLFRSRPVVVSLTVGSIGMAGFYGVVFTMSLYFQQVRGATALETGLLFLPMTVLLAALNPLAARVAAVVGPRPPIVAGQLLMVAGLVLLALAPRSTPEWWVAAMMVPVGVGGSFTVPPLTSLMLDSVPAPRAGIASGVLNTFRQVGGSLGVAGIGAVIGHHAGFVEGMRTSLLTVAALVCVGVLVSLMLRGDRTETP